MFFVYIIKSSIRNYTYVGLCKNVERRIKQHQDGREKTTKPYRPFKLIKVETFLTRDQARAREKFLKSGIGREYVKNIISPGGGTGRRA